MSDSKNNIQFNYLYRNGGNFKIWGSEILSNPDSLPLNEVEERIRKSLIDGEFLDPSFGKSRDLNIMIGFRN